MIKIEPKLTIKDFPTIRSWRAAATAAHGEMGEHYHRTMVPKHFQSGAEQKYRYRRRAAGYRRRDPANPGRETRVQRAVRRGEAHRDALTHPLVLSGLLRRSLTQFATIRAFPTRAKVQFQAPVYAPGRQRTTKQPPIADEALRTTRRENQELRRLLNTSLEKRLKQAKSTVKK